MMVRATAYCACRDCAQPGFGGPGENRFTAFDAIGRNDAGRAAGFPQVYVNTSNLTLFLRITDLTFGGSPPALSLERSYNQDDTHSGPFGTGWSFNLGDTLASDADGNRVLRRGSGRLDRFAPNTAGTGFFALSGTTDTLLKNSDGSFTLRTPASTTSRTFSADGRLLSIQDSGITRVSLDYDNNAHITAAHYRGRLLQFTYDDNGRIASVEDSSGRKVSYSYTADGRLSTQTNADGQGVGYHYDDAGNLSSIDYAGGSIVIAYTGDPGYVAVSSVMTPDNAVRKYDIPLSPTQIRLTDGNGDATLYTSNANGLLQSVTDANGNTTSYTYDAAGHRVSTVNGAGETTRFAYDPAGNLSGITDSGGNKWSADYTAAGLAHLTDANGNIWTLSYDALGNLTGVSNPAGGSFAATRSATGQITALTDALGNKTGYLYNTDGLISTFTDALGGKWTYDYDGAARASSRTDPSGKVLSAGYTAGNRLASLGADDIVSPFDYSGLVRDSLNRPASYTDSFGNQVGYTYDAAGQLSTLTLPGGKAVTYTYDHAHRLSQVTDWLGNFALYRYDAAGWPVSVSVSGGPVTIYQYDAARRLRATVSTGPDGSPVAGYRYTLDANGNRTGVSALEPKTTLNLPAANTIAIDAANHPVSRTDGQSYQYDALGNLTGIQGSRNVTLGYDAFGRLTSFTADSATAYSYDVAGLRAVRTVDGTDRRFVYDLSGSEPRVVMEADSANTPVAWYVYGLGLLWKVAADGAPYFYHFDGDGNVVALSNPTAGVVNRYRYDPQGHLSASDEGVENMFRARGASGWIDDGNGLIFTGRNYQFPALRLTLPSTADPSPPVPLLALPFTGPGACFVEGVANCLQGTGRRAQ